MYDLIIIGGGPAGLTAGIFAVRYGLKTLLLAAPGQPSQLALAAEVENYPGFKKIPGVRLLDRMSAHARTAGVEIKSEPVVDIKIKKDKQLIITGRVSYLTRTTIIATGAAHRKAGIPGETEFLGKGVSYCASCDGVLFKGKPVVVWGGGDSALSAAIYLHDIGCRVTLVHRRAELRATAALVDKAKKVGVQFVLGRTIKKITGKKFVEKVVLDNGKEIICSAVFIAIGEVPAVELAKKVGIMTDKDDFIIVDAEQATNIAGIFAAGDVTITPLRQIITAAADGAIAAMAAYKYLKSQKG